MDFYVGQTVRVNDECCSYYDDDFHVDYVWGEGMSTFCGHEFVIRGIDENSGRIYLASKFSDGEDGYVTSRSGRDVWTFYFCQGWLTPVNEDADTSALDDFFEEWSE